MGTSRSAGLAAALLLLLGAACRQAPETAPGVDVQSEDPALKVVPIDHAPGQSLISVRVDAAGRIFAGGREKLFVYEPAAEGDYRPRQELYRFPEESWLFDIAVRGDDLYVSTASAVYLIPQAVRRRQGLQPRRILWGQPRGHIQLGFHGMAWGPEGDLYVAMGDPLQHYGDFARPDHWGHWTLFSGPENTPTPYTGVGAMLRMRPDGSNLRVFSTGSFNHFGVAFDRRWNLFSNDHDREAMPMRYVPARLLHVAPHSYFGWPRGWLASKTPDRADLLATVYEGLGREAPVGLVFYDEAFLPERFRNSLLMGRWAQRLISRHRLRERGASYESGDEPVLVSRNISRPLGVEVGRGGRIFVTVGEMAHLEGSPVFDAHLAMLTRSDDAPSHPFDAYEAAEAPEDRLWKELSKPSWQERYRAHVEILRRGGPLLEEATRRLSSLDREDPSALHLPWLAAAGGSPEAFHLLEQLAAGPDAELRIQAVRALGEFQAKTAGPGFFAALLKDPEPRVQQAALTSLFGLSSAPLPEIAAGPARSEDTYLRQAAALLLAGRASPVFLEQLSRQADAAARLAAVLAVGFRLTMPAVSAPLDPRLPLDPYPDSAVVIRYDQAEVDLRKLGRVGNFTSAEHWKAGPHTAEQEAEFSFLVRMLRDKSEAVRRQAAYFLSLLGDSRSEPLVEQVLLQDDRQRLEGAPVSILKAVKQVWAAGPFEDGAQGWSSAHPPERGPVDLNASYPQGGGRVAWSELSASGSYLNFAESLGSRDNASYYVSLVLESGLPQTVMFFVGSNDGVKVWHNGALVWENDVERPALSYNDMILLRLQQGSNPMLVRVHNRRGDSGLYIHYKALEPLDVTLPRKVDLSRLSAQVTEGGPSRRALLEGVEKLDWERFPKGDAARGKALFEERGCVRCHSLGGAQASAVGPSLVEAGKRFTLAQLAEAILLPSRQVSPVFRQTQLQMRRGEVVAGLVVGETADRVELVLSDASRRTIPKPDIRERTLQDLSPMPDDLVGTVQELQDLLAFLAPEESTTPGR